MLDTISDLWNTIKYSIIPDDMDDVAEKIVNILIEDYDADDIKSAFYGDKNILTALAAIDSVDTRDWDELEEDTDLYGEYDYEDEDEEY